LSHTLTSACDRAGAAKALAEAIECGIGAKHRARVLMQNFWQEVGYRRGASALQYLDEALDLAGSSTSIDAMQVITEFLHCHVIGTVGAIDRIERFCRLVDVTIDAPPSLHAASLRMRAWVKLFRGDVADALKLADETLARNEGLTCCRWTTLEATLIQTIG